MNLEQLENELDLIIMDRTLKPRFRDWLNQAVEEIATDFHLPGLRTMEPWRLAVNADNWLYDMPENYLKSVYRVARGTDFYPVTILRDIAELEGLDPGHREVGEDVNCVGITGAKIGIYPKANDILWLWYYRRPIPMENPQDEPDGIPPAFHGRVLIPKVVIRNFKLIQDMMTQPPHKSLEWWLEEYKTGLYGSARGEIGLINCIARDKGVRRHGGRDPLP